VSDLRVIISFQILIYSHIHSHIIGKIREMMYLLTISYVWPSLGNNHSRKQHHCLNYFIQSQWRSWRCNQLFKIQSITSQFHFYCRKTWILFFEKPDYWFWKSSGSWPNCDVSLLNLIIMIVLWILRFFFFVCLCYLGASKIELVEIKSLYLGQKQRETLIRTCAISIMHSNSSQK
jgi:hypothetical protein